MFINTKLFCFQHQPWCFILEQTGSAVPDTGKVGPNMYTFITNKACSSMNTSCLLKPPEEAVLPASGPNWAFLTILYHQPAPSFLQADVKTLPRPDLCNQPHGQIQSGNGNRRGQSSELAACRAAPKELGMRNWGIKKVIATFCSKAYAVPSTCRIQRAKHP